MTYTLGIDLGTSSVTAAAGGAARVEMLPLGRDSPEFPACLGWADTLLVGDDARDRALAGELRPIEGVKRRLGDPTPILVGGTPRSVESLVAALLRPAVERATRLRGGPPERVVLTHPAHWGPYRRDALVEAGRVAGLPIIHTVTEAEAAVTEYLSRHEVPPGHLIGVYGLGGGMFDAALLRVGVDGPEPVGVAEGFENLGGLDFDAAVLDFVHDQIGPAFEELDVVDSASAAAFARLWRDCSRAKDELSWRRDVTIPVDLPGRRLEVRLDRATFELRTRELVHATVDQMSRVIAGAEVSSTDIATVLLVGGASRMPQVARMLTGETGVPVRASGHPRHVVALGAVLSFRAAGTAVAGTAVAGFPRPAPTPGEPDRAERDPGLVVKAGLVGLLTVVLVLVVIFTVHAVAAVS